mmetsp:Transcript_93106/g.284951  ORF Transcript_93106/g.284951 Transcript_93106/m.284951 type:complete len:101 (+) Transcript_93106:655-957(+)
MRDAAARNSDFRHVALIAWHSASPPVRAAVAAMTEPGFRLPLHVALGPAGRRPALRLAGAAGDSAKAQRPAGSAEAALDAAGVQQSVSPAEVAPEAAGVQ